MSSPWAMIEFGFFLRVMGAHWRVLSWNLRQFREAQDAAIASYTVSIV